MQSIKVVSVVIETFSIRRHLGIQATSRIGANLSLDGVASEVTNIEVAQAVKLFIVLVSSESAFRSTFLKAGNFLRIALGINIQVDWLRLGTFDVVKVNDILVIDSGVAIGSDVVVGHEGSVSIATD